MAKDTKSPSPPSIYDNMASMPGKDMSAAGGPGGPGGDGKGAAGGDSMEIVSTLFRVLEKWRKSDDKAAKYIDQMMEPLKNYAMTELKKDPKEFAGSTTDPAPSAAGGQGPSSAGAGADPGASQPVPA